jgi:hypothetical protein
MTTPGSLSRPQRCGIRYPLHLPVALKLAQKQINARSENISLGGILLCSAFLVPEGSTVEVAVGVAQLPNPGAQLRARGKVLRVQPKATGDFAVAIAFERPFELGLQGLDSSSDRQGDWPSFLKPKNTVVPSAWHTET